MTFADNLVKIVSRSVWVYRKIRSIRRPWGVHPFFFNRQQRPSLANGGFLRTHRAYITSAGVAVCIISMQYAGIQHNTPYAHCTSIRGHVIHWIQPYTHPYDWIHYTQMGYMGAYLDFNSELTVSVLTCLCEDLRSVVWLALRMHASFSTATACLQ